VCKPQNGWKEIQKKYEKFKISYVPQKWTNFKTFLKSVGVAVASASMSLELFALSFKVSETSTFIRTDRQKII